MSKPTFVIRMDRQRQDMAKPPAGMTRGEQQIREAFIDGFLSCAGNGEIYGADAARAWRDENETGRPSPAGAAMSDDRNSFEWYTDQPPALREALTAAARELAAVSWTTGAHALDALISVARAYPQRPVQEQQT